MMHMGLDGHNECGGRDCACESVTRQRLDVSTPVRVVPIVQAGSIMINCEKPKICGFTERPCKRVCEFIIKQTINIEIPICYDIRTDIGDSFIDCAAL